MYTRAFISLLAALLLAIATLTVAGVLLAFMSEGYSHFILALVALTAVVGVGLNVLLGLSGQVSLGHVGFYAIGAYTAAILTVNGVSFWIAFPVAGLITGIVGALLALPALRASGPYLAMITIAFAFIVQHATIESQSSQYSWAMRKNSPWATAGCRATRRLIE